MDWSTVTAPITTSAKMGKKISAYLRHFDQYVQFYGWKKKWWKGTNVTTAQKEPHNFESSFQPPLNRRTFPKMPRNMVFFGRTVASISRSNSILVASQLSIIQSVPTQSGMFLIWSFQKFDFWLLTFMYPIMDFLNLLCNFLRQP